MKNSPPWHGRKLSFLSADLSSVLFQSVINFQVVFWAPNFQKICIETIDIIRKCWKEWDEGWEKMGVCGKGKFDNGIIFLLPINNLMGFPQHHCQNIQLMHACMFCIICTFNQSLSIESMEYTQYYVGMHFIVRILMMS